MSNNGIPPLNDWQADNYPVIYDEGAAELQYVKTGNKNTINTGGLGYLVYTALLTQSGTNAPVATVIGENTIGNIVWSYNGQGDYIGTLEGAFNGNIAIFFGKPGSAAPVNYGLTGITNDTIEIVTNNILLEGFYNDLLSNTPIEIRVYP